MTPPDDAPADRAAFLRDLAGHGFLPPDGWPLLANDRLGTILPVTPDAEAALTAAVGDAVDGFAAEFWALSPAERHQRWAGLSARAADGPTAAFLAHLERGLNSIAAPHPDPVADELAGVARELMVLRPRPRAVRRAAWLAEKAGDGTTWPATVRRLRAVAPVAAGFDPALVAALARGAAPRAVPASPRRETGEPVRFDRMTLTAPAKPTKPASPWNKWHVGLMVLFVVGQVVRVAVKSSPTPDPPKPPVYRYTPPGPPVVPPRMTTPVPPPMPPPGFGFDPRPGQWGGPRSSFDDPRVRDMLDKMHGVPSFGPPRDRIDPMREHFDRMKSLNPGFPPFGRPFTPPRPAGDAMTPPDLPDDPRRWPNDPFAVLGVPPDAADVDLKRAYTRLIRRFKPEHHSEQFRRIREAYEACQQRTAWFFPEMRADPAPAQPRPAPAGDEANRLWNLAAAGDEAAAYDGLTTLARSQPDRADAPLRMYWLLALSPGLDDGRTRHDWLADALVRSRLRGPAAELYRRELAADPAAGLYGPYADLLAAPCDPADLLAVTRWRVEAAGRTWRLFLLAADLRAVRNRLTDISESDWLALLANAHGWAAWDQTGEATAFLKAELAGVKHLAVRYGPFFDRIEETEHVASAARQGDAHLLPEELLAVVRATWAGADPTPAEVACGVAEVAADPHRYLDRFDRVVREKGPGLVVLLVRALEMHRMVHGPRDDPPFPADHVRGLARRLDPQRSDDYPGLRAGLLDLLVAEAVHPAEFAAACGADRLARYRTLGEWADGDPSLRAVWLAVRLARG